MSQTTQLSKKPLVCKYCNVVQIEFDVNRKSKSGKLLPIEVASGIPHSCPQNPWNLQKSSGTNTAKPTEAFRSIELAEITRKIDLVVSAMEQLCRTYSVKVDGLTRE
jgi:hypothetical protein